MTAKATQTDGDQEVREAKRTLHRALTLALNKIVCPLILRFAWNRVVKDRPLSYTESALLCIGAASVHSFATFSSDM